MPLAPGTLLGPYEIVGLLGAGGMGEVYKARDTRLGRTVAVKVAKEAFEERFRNEALAVAALNHPHIAKLYDVGPDYLVMEHVAGKPLRGPLAVAEALKLCVQIVDALEHAHRNGIVHRDLKPANVLVGKGGVKVLDFGLAQRRVPMNASGDDGSPTVSADGAIAGTPRYMAPEQIEGKPADERTDVFAFGLVLYEMLTGDRAFEGESAAGVMASILEKEPDPISSRNPGVPPAVEKVVATCLAKDPADRWQSARELKHAIEWAGQAAPSSGRGAWRAWAVAAAAVVVAIGLGAVLLFQLNRVSRARPVRLHLATAPGAQAFLTPNAVSPDGQKIALVMRSASSPVPRLFLRSLDVLLPVEVPGGERGVGPFWSPDGRQLAFWKLGLGGLYKVDAAGGGTPELLCQACLGGGGADAFGATWGPTGVIVYSDVGKLLRVPAQGGDPEPLGAVLPGENGRYWPQFLPDGRRFLYLSLASRAEDSGLYVGALDSDLRVRLVGTAFIGAYSPPGQLVFIKGDVLVAQPFDLERLVVSGEPVPIVDEEVMRFKNPVLGGAAAYAISASGVLAWNRHAGDSGQLVWRDRTGRTLEAIGDPDAYWGVLLSPDEKSVVACRGEPGKRDIWILDAASGAGRRLTFDPGDECTPAWSPDGAWIAYSATRQRGRRELYRTRADGSGGDELVLASEELSAHIESWSADGRFLSFNAARPGNSIDLFVLPLRPGGEPIPFVATPAMETAGKLSPNGRYLAYMSTETGRPEVYVREVTPEGAPGPGKWQISHELGWAPRWRADGRELYFHDKAKALLAVAVEIEGPTFKSGPPELIGVKDVPNDGGWFGVTRDGQRFLMNTAPKAPEPIRVLVNWLP